MLLINTRRDQVVRVADSASVLVNAIIRTEEGPDYIIIGIDYSKSRFPSMKNLPPENRHKVKVGDSLQIYTNVVLTLTKVLIGSEYIAVLGFDAPREVPIRGTWMEE